jgi:Na+/H+ antiporter NhaD/arsenite permease-like protein
MGPESFFNKLVITIIFIIAAVALFNWLPLDIVDTPKTPFGVGANALEIDAMNVNHVIARQFNLPSVSGVLVNETPTGRARKTLDIKRGDVILEYNNTSVHSVGHLAYLMSQRRPGDTVTFQISRNGKIFSTSAKMPRAAEIADVYNTTTFSIVIVLVILILTFSALFFNLLDRTVTVVMGAAFMLIWGSLFGFYDQAKAFDSIRMSPILIFIGMSVFSIFLERLKFFDYVAKNTIVKMKGDTIKVVFALCSITYLFSLLVNNLSTIMVMIPVTLYVCRGLNLNPVPVVIAEIVSSNIGGASTMVGDFPNMMISSSTGLEFFDFIIFMLPVCFILLLCLFLYMKRFGFTDKKKRSSAAMKKASLQRLKDEVENLDVDWLSVRRVLIILAFVILGFMVLPVFRIKPATIVLTGCFILLAIENKQAAEVIKKIGLADIIFFMALFILVGGALHSGLLKSISNFIVTLSAGHKMLYLILLMWTAAFFTAFLNAGPATVLFIPVVMHSHFAASSDIAWWALSLGVLAGSSATITGATAGIVAQTMLEESDLNENKGRFTFRVYSTHGLPIALMFLIISSVYIAFLCSVLAY